MYGQLKRPLKKRSPKSARTGSGCLEGNIKNKNVPLERNTTSKNATHEGMGKQQLVPANALCSYPLVKMEIGDSSQISTTAPIFSQYDYFRQTIWRLASVQFHF